MKNYNTTIYEYLIVGLCSLMLLAGCSKSTTITEVPPTPPTPPGTPPPSVPEDSAQLIFFSSLTYVYGAQPRVAAFNAAKTLIWEKPWHPSGFYGVVYGNNTLYLNTYAAPFSSLSTVNIMTGAEGWKLTNTRTICNSTYHGDTIVTAIADNAGTPGNKLLLLNRETGAVIWSVDQLYQSMCAPVVSDGMIYSHATNQYGTDQKLYAYDLATKAKVWEKTVGSFVIGGLPPPMLISGDTLFLGAGAAGVSLINKKTGNTIWSKAFDTEHAFLFSDKFVFYNHSLSKIQVVSRRTGELIRESERYLFGNSNRSYVYKDRFYLPIENILYVYNINDGTVTTSTIRNFSSVRKMLVAGNTLYMCNTTTSGSGAETKDMFYMMNPETYTPKDSLTQPPYQSYRFGLLDTKGRFYY